MCSDIGEDARFVPIMLRFWCLEGKKSENTLHTIAWYGIQADSPWWPFRNKRILGQTVYHHHILPKRFSLTNLWWISIYILIVAVWRAKIGVIEFSSKRIKCVYGKWISMNTILISRISLEPPGPSQTLKDPTVLPGRPLEPFLILLYPFGPAPLKVVPILLRFYAFWGAAPIWNCASLTTLV